MLLGAVAHTTWWWAIWSATKERLQRLLAIKVFRSEPIATASSVAPRAAVNRSMVLLLLGFEEVGWLFDMCVCDEGCGSGCEYGRIAHL